MSVEQFISMIRNRRPMSELAASYRMLPRLGKIRVRGQLEQIRIADKTAWELIKPYLDQEQTI